LLDAPAIHDHHRIRDCKRFLLIVGHEHRRDAELPLDGLELAAHVLAQIGIERGERLVEQQHVRLDHDGARQRDTLLLTARELRRQAALDVG
jgi:hypothetical protein